MKCAKRVAAGMVLAIAAIGPSSALAQFADIGAGLTRACYASVAWGDYDSDGDLDLLIAGTTDSSECTFRVYENDAGSFTDADVGLPRVAGGSVAWGDYDNDGDLDILMTGSTGSESISRIYENDAGSFTDIGAGLPGVVYASAAWGDYDNDGDLDILMAGLTSSAYISRIYENDAGSFTNISAGLQGVGYGSAAWGDYDNDGDLDILLTGSTGSESISRIYENDAGSFADIGAGLTGVQFGSAAWGDCDNDGDLDILITGVTDPSGAISRVYENDAGSFTDIGTGLPGVGFSSAAWGDYDNDGDLDILIAGGTVSLGAISRVYENDAGSFTDIVAGLPGVVYASAAWGDYDNDGDLDILLTGYADSACISNVYRSDGPTANTQPAPPLDLSGALVGNTATFNWDPATDAETPSAGLSYNLRVGTTPGGSEKVSPMAEVASGYRRVTQLGNVQQRTSWTLTLPPGTYYWSVQAIDGCFAGSPFAEEQILIDTPVENAFYATFVDEDGSVRLRWSLASCPGGEGLLVYRATSVEGPYCRITSEPLPDADHGSYVDETAWPGATFWYELRVLLPSGDESLATDIRASVTVLGSLTAGIRYVSPNPATEHAAIGYSLPNGWRSARLSIYDATGRVVKRLDPAKSAEGWVTADWDGTSGSGERVASGVYFVRLVVDGAVAAERLVILR